MDRARYHRRSAKRIAAGLCPRCGVVPPAPNRAICTACAEKSNKASRARDARLRAAGEPRRDPGKARAYERQRSARLAAERAAAGICTKCGHTPAEPGRRLCEPCADRRRQGERAREARARAEGKPYGGRNPENKRRIGRLASKRRREVRLATGLCPRCGKRPPAPNAAVCEPCASRRREADQQQYAERRASGSCTRCGEPAFDGSSRCSRCAALEVRDPERKNRTNRARYARRRVRSECTDCGAPSFGASRCPACAERSYHRSAHFRGLPELPTQYTVIETATGIDHGTWDSLAQVAAALAYAKLSPEDVTLLTDSSPITSYASWH